MTRKHFETLAQALTTVRPHGYESYINEPDMLAWGDCVRVISNVCAQSNPRFDRDKFIKACEQGS